MRSILQAGCFVLLLIGTASAQVHVELRVPSFRWVAPPPMVVVAPGIQVVEDYDEEVFFDDGWYWYRSGATWYRSHDHQGNWVVIPAPRVPARLVQLPTGSYRHYKADRRAEKVERKAVQRVERVERRGGHGKLSGANPGRGNGPRTAR